MNSPEATNRSASVILYRYFIFVKHGVFRPHTLLSLFLSECFIAGTLAIGDSWEDAINKSHFILQLSYTQLLLGIEQGVCHATWCSPAGYEECGGLSFGKITGSSSWMGTLVCFLQSGVLHLSFS